MLPATPAAILRLLGSPRAGERILNLGSSTRPFYVESQPHIWTGLMEPIIRAGNRLVNFDKKRGDGIDVTGDAHELEFPWGSFDGVLCCSLLEHVERPLDVVAQCVQVLKPGGWFIGDVPADYPHHSDPIDNMLRMKTLDDWRAWLDPRLEIHGFEAIDTRATVVMAVKL